MPLLRLAYKTIHYTDLSPTTSTPPKGTILLTHGLGSSQNFYAALFPALLAANFRVIAYDTTGAARSPYTQIEQSIATLADDANALLAALDVPRALLVGHSMGGTVALHALAQHSPRLAGAVLLGPVHPTPGVADAFAARIAAVEKDAMDAMAAVVPATALAADAAPLARAFVRELLLAQDPRGYISHCRVIANATPPDYASVKAPVLLLAGEEDKAAPLASCERIVDALGSGRKGLRVLKGVGHWHAVEAPEEVGKAIVEFAGESGCFE
ncbi:uncharacterized protein K452DRAFT_282302 [Aplosporella prunicola CBS 121167]|uniref:Serine aminopeptidase S33 domain-containing protein n=1 Tax=Aplosporella prunicola CBS 121167 TaxID=1176127 RepID=A0A6A6BWS8_9PEZI|nr:uncharacterized protein K452DRAFT_282302 [Aplosporella prunicola CBS 121167]KAF2147304.1 hypothetical protein K452DRAFT_282302 [Aplosporella prunicola CBS 121167]